MKHFNNIDWHVTDRCNLRCVSCGHFCSLVDHMSDTTDRTVEEAERDFSILYEKTNNGEYVDNITLTGGECTLNKNLPDIIEVAYKYFPNKVIIWSNCINLSLYTEKLLNVLKKYSISVNVTLYKPNRKETILNFFNKHNIQCNIYSKEFIETDDHQPQFFNKFFTINEIEGNKELLYCEPKFNCCQLRDQKLYVCQYMSYLPYLFNQFGNEYSSKIGYENSNKYLDLTIYNDYRDIVDYVEYYNEDICQHCIDKWCDADFSNRVQKRLQPWHLSNKNVNEWIIDDIKSL